MLSGVLTLTMELRSMSNHTDYSFDPEEARVAGCWEPAIKLVAGLSQRLRSILSFSAGALIIHDQKRRRSYYDNISKPNATEIYMMMMIAKR
jgi:hypothetical protein